MNLNTEVVLINTVGTLGAILLLFGFYRVTRGQWTNKSLWYELDNVIGALLVITYQIYYHAYVGVVVNLIWGGVAFAGVMVFFKRFHAHQAELRRKHGKKRSS